MPTYDFECKNCSHAFSELTPYHSRDQVACPNCGTKGATIKITTFFVGKSQSSRCDTGGCSSKASPSACPGALAGGCPGMR
ncbi:zinc ribbon domain-containing protein [Heliorestis acidaminivorans]|uniref:Zinc ribbon domain-containing protein n=1 Tax=Heliorestis acidaminivorans TaxID=553427 RepID=A0A6I0F561_9FIRM|nr:zinc ribbon domain-containing protein [Heliorestis acidaminivorans]KAB2954132.1 zinc ribbon domain-containing protein [Heliorestis acidaminivorans]